MNTMSRTLTGIIGIIFGILLIIVGIIIPTTLLYGIPILIISIIIFFNNKEDNIEKIKTKTKGGKK